MAEKQIAVQHIYSTEAMVHAVQADQGRVCRMGTGSVSMRLGGCCSLWSADSWGDDAMGKKDQGGADGFSAQAQALPESAFPRPALLCDNTSVRHDENVENLSAQEVSRCVHQATSGSWSRVCPGAS